MSNSLSTGIVSSKDKDHVNFEQAEEVGKTIQHGLGNILFDTATIKRKDQITNFESLQNSKATKSKEENGRTMYRVQPANDCCNA